MGRRDAAAKGHVHFSARASTSRKQGTPEAARRWRRRLWLALLAAVSSAALWAALPGTGSLHAFGAGSSEQPRLALADGTRAARLLGRAEPAGSGAAYSVLLSTRLPTPLPALPPAPDASATASVSGSVVDALGGPIAGAKVSAFRDRAEAALTSTVTTESGGFVLRAPPGPLRVVAELEAYSTALAQVVAPASSLTLSLAPASRIFGRVRATSDEPVAGAVVHARLLGRLDPLVPSSVSDAEGRFQFEALSAGEYELSVTAARLSGDPERVVIRVSEEVGPIELRVAPAARVALELERGGRACTAGWVNLLGERFQGAREIAAGRVLFEGVPSGSYSLLISCEAAAAQPQELQVDDADIERTIRLDPGLALRGRVSSAAGAGLAGVLVTAAPMGEPGGRAYLTCRTGADGEFLCDGLSAGAYRCHAGLELQPQSEFVHVQLVEGTPAAPVELRLRPRAALVVSLDAAPADRLSRVRVAASHAPGPPLEGELRGSEFHFDGLLLGSYSVYLPASPATRREVVLERDGQRVDVSLPWPRTRSISGVVLDERGQPAVEVWVRATAEGSFLPFASLSEVGVAALTDAAGRFSVEGLFEGRYHLRADGIDREGGVASVPSGTLDVAIHLAAPRAVDDPPDREAHNAIAAATRTLQRAPEGAPEPTKEERP